MITKKCAVGVIILLLPILTAVPGSAWGAEAPPVPQRSAAQSEVALSAELLPLRLIDQVEVSAHALAQDGTVLLVAGRENGLWLIDIGRPWHPRLKGYHSLWNRGVWGVTLQGNYAFVASSKTSPGETGLYVVDISDLSRPQVVGSCPTHTAARDVAISGHYAYVADDFNGLVVIDISDLASPSLVTTQFAGGTAWRIQVSNPYAYIAAGWGGLAIFDISNPRAPVKMGSFKGLTSSEYTRDVSVAGTYSFVAQYAIECCPAATWAGVRRVSIANPAIPTGAGSYATPWGEGVTAAREYVFVADGSHGLKILLETGTGSFELVASSDTAGFSRDIVRFGNYVYVADGLRLLVLWFAPPVSRTLTSGGGTLDSPDDQTSYEFPIGPFGSNVTVTHTPRYDGDVPGSGWLKKVGHSFEIDARSVATGQSVQPSQPYTIRIQYTDAERGSVIEGSLGLYYWNGSNWVREATSVVDPSVNTLTATPNRFSLWSVMGETHTVFLPLAAK